MSNRRRKRRLESRANEQSRERLVRIMSMLCCDVWLIRPDRHAVLTNIASAHAAGGMAEEEQHAQAAALPPNPAPRAYEMEGTTAIIPIDGVLARKFSNVLQTSGITSTDIFQELVEDAAEDPGVEAIVLNVDSPGGYAMGIPEAARAVADARKTKPVIAYADGMMGSGAYWIASQADGIYATPSAQVGSIGAYIAFLDSSRAAELAGLKVDVFRSGRFKGMGLPGTALTDEHRAVLQADVDKTAGQFREAVAAGRRKVSDDSMQGLSYDAADALARNLIDRIGTLDDALKEATAMGERAKRRKATT